MILNLKYVTNVWKVNSKKVVIVLDGDAWSDSLKLYHRINVGRLMGRVWVIKLDNDKDIADIKGDLSNYKEIQLD